MAEFPKSISIDVEPIIKPSVANMCLATLELFINQNPEIEIIEQRLTDGTIHLKAVVRKENEPPKEEEQNA